MQGTASYPQIRAMILEEVAEAERLHASLETERPLPGAKGGLFLLPATERAMLWRPLATRLEAEAALPSEEELTDLWREYEWAKAIQIRLPRRVAWYQLSFMVAAGFFAVAPFELESTEYQHLSDILPYMLASFWGIVGGCAASLWQLLKEVEGRSLSGSSGVSHLLRPYLGAVLGLLVSLILPANLLDIEGADINLTGYALAALAGLSERTFIGKLQQLLEVLLGQVGSDKVATVVAARQGLTKGGASRETGSTAAAVTTQPAASVASALLSAAQSANSPNAAPTGEGASA